MYYRLETPSASWTNFERGVDVVSLSKLHEDPALSESYGEPLLHEKQVVSYKPRTTGMWKSNKGHSVWACVPSQENGLRT